MHFIASTAETVETIFGSALLLFIPLQWKYAEMERASTIGKQVGSFPYGLGMRLRWV